MHNSKIPKTVAKWIERNAEIVDDFFVEFDQYQGDGKQGDYSIWLALKAGFKNGATDTHQIHAATAKEFLNETKYIEICDCEHNCKRKVIK